MKPENILIIQTAFIGDIVLTIPMLKRLKDRFPGTRLTMLTTPAGGGLMTGQPCLDDVILFDKRNADRGLRGLARLSGSLRDRKFDMVISPHRSFRSSIIARMTGSPERIGYRENSLSFLYTSRVRRNPALHEVERIMALLEPVKPGLSAEPFDLGLELSEDDMGHADDFIAAAGAAGKRIVAVCPGSNWATKMWTEDGFAGLCNGLEKMGRTPMILGDSRDGHLGKVIASRAGGAVIDATGKTGLRLFASILRRSGLLVCNDSGPGHIARAVGTPVVAVFGPTVTGFGFVPYGGQVRVVEVNGLKCRPCDPHGPAVCPIGTHECMESISAGEVLDRCRELLNN